MDTETLNAIKTLFEEYSAKDSGTITAAYLTVGGMLGVSILGAVTQWLITKKILREEHKRLSMQLQTEFQARRHEKWEHEVLEAITNLLTVTDPEINTSFDPAIVTKHVIRVQILLNLHNQLQAEINHLVNELALTVNGWRGDRDPEFILRIHAQLTEKTRLLIYHPN